MGKIRKSVIYFSGLLLILFSCFPKRQDKNINLSSHAHQVTAKEVLQATNYTYVQVGENNHDYWIAINKSDVDKGNTYYWSQGVPMRNFNSKELNRTFPFIVLVQDFTDKPITSDKPAATMPGTSHMTIPEKEDINIKPAEGGITIADLYAHKELYQGKTVKIRGVVVKYNSMIMGKNWIHIQDGSENNSKYDLAITSQDNVRLGDVVAFRGTISLNKDFGAGYFYDVIMENATLEK